jgi:phosphoglycerate dehydrogenase-like enzyme
MRPGASLVNVSRGRLVDEPALAAALAAGAISGAGLDVRAQEPPGSPDPLADAPNLFLTPHVAGVSRASFEDLHREAATTAIELLRAAARLPAFDGTPAR